MRAQFYVRGLAWKDTVPDVGDLDPAPTRERRALVAIGAVAAGLFVLRLLGAWWPHFKLTYPDSYSFLKVAGRGPFHPRFWFDERPVGYPLFLWSLARSITLVTLAQTLGYIAAFLALCATARRVLTSRTAAAAAVIGFVAIAVQRRFALWNTQILSESLSMALAVASIAAWWRAAAAPTVRTVRWALVATVAWMLVRDANAIPAAVVLIPALFAIAISRRAAPAVRRTLLSGVAAIVMVTAFIGLGDGASQRNQYPMNNNIGLRVLPNPGLTAWFVAGGMPIDAALRSRSGHVSWDDNEAFLRDPALARYRRWARDHGRTRLALSMVVRFGDWRHRLYDEFPNIVRSSAVDDYDTFTVGDRTPRRIPFGVGGASSRTQLFAWTGLAVAGVAAAATDKQRRVVALFAGAGLLSAVVDIYISYVGDALEVNRHMVGPLARLAVMTVICVAIGVDRLLTPVGARR